MRPTRSGAPVHVGTDGELWCASTQVWCEQAFSVLLGGLSKRHRYQPAFAFPAPREGVRLLPSNYCHFQQDISHWWEVKISKQQQYLLTQRHVFL